MLFINRFSRIKLTLTILVKSFFLRLTFGVNPVEVCSNLLSNIPLVHEISFLTKYSMLLIKGAKLTRVSSVFRGLTLSASQLTVLVCFSSVCFSFQTERFPFHSFVPSVCIWFVLVGFFETLWLVAFS